MTPAAVGFIILLLMAVSNLYLGRSVLYPPAQFTLIWSALVGASLLWSQSYFPLSVLAVCIFCAGAAAFSAGGMLRLAVEQRTRRNPPPPMRDARSIRRLLTAGLILLALIFPLFWRHMLSVADTRFSNLWWAIRSGAIALSEVQGRKSWEQAFYDNMIVVAILLALTAVAHHGERGMSRIVAPGLVLLATTYNLATGSRSGAAAVLLGSVGIRMVKSGRLRVRHVVAGFLAAFVMYVPLTLLRAGSGGNLVATASQDLQLVGDTALLYTVGPLAAFDAYLQDPAGLPETWSISYFFLHAANRLGLDVAAPSTHMGYVAVGPRGATNVYTMYFAYYPELGIVGVVLLTALVGYLVVWVYSAALSGRGSVLILYGLAFNEICKSAFNEGFFMGLNMWVKAGLFSLAIYLLERNLTRRAANHPAASDPAISMASACCE